MLGWLSAASVCASRVNLANRSESWESKSGRTLSATSRLSLESRARNTSPIPPTPRLAVTSYGPRREPRVRGNGDAIIWVNCRAARTSGSRWRSGSRQLHDRSVVDAPERTSDINRSHQRGRNRPTAGHPSEHSTCTPRHLLANHAVRTLGSTETAGGEREAGRTTSRAAKESPYRRE